MAMRTTGIMYFLDFKGLSGFSVDSFKESVFIKNKSFKEHGFNI